MALIIVRLKLSVYINRNYSSDFFVAFLLSAAPSIITNIIPIRVMMPPSKSSPVLGDEAVFSEVVVVVTVVVVVVVVSGIGSNLAESFASAAGTIMRVSALLASSIVIPSASHSTN